MSLARTVKWFWNIYLFGNVHIALCALALALTTDRILALGVRHELLTFIFCATFLGYNFQRLPSAFEKPVTGGCWRLSWTQRYRFHLFVLSVIGIVLSVWSYRRLYLHTELFALIPAALSCAYILPVIPSTKTWLHLRQVPRLKIFVIALAWTSTCVLLPAAAAHRDGRSWLPAGTALWSIVCALLIFALTIPFDIRDLLCDEPGLKTLPAILGVRNAIRLAVGALVLSSVLVWVNLKYAGTGTMGQAIAYSAWCAITGWVVFRSRPDRHEYYFAFLIDGLLLLLWALIRLTS